MPSSTESTNRFNFFTPQGDGNFSCRHPRILGSQFQFFYPARGRKPKTEDVATRLLVSIFLPRKGTETTPLWQFDLWSKLVSIFLPRKGTETLALSTKSEFQGFNFFTPQGDGNTNTKVNNEEMINVSIFLPRKGTETWCLSIQFGTNQIGFNFFTPQGDGNPYRLESPQ